MWIIEREGQHLRNPEKISHITCLIKYTKIIKASSNTSIYVKKLKKLISEL